MYFFNVCFIKYIEVFEWNENKLDINLASIKNQTISRGNTKKRERAKEKTCVDCTVSDI